MDSAPTYSAPDAISADLRMILRGLMVALGAWRLEGVLALALYRRVGLVAGRMERMLVRFRAGKLWRVPQRETASGLRARGKVGFALPRRFGWLVQKGGHTAACAGLQLQAVLNTPEMAELLAASAQARRILRPICRALAVELPGVSGAAVPFSGQTRRRRARTRVVAETFRISLPRGVLTAARRQGFGKDR